MDGPKTSHWHLLLPSTTREKDPAFRSVLTRVLHTGLRQCGTIGLVASLLYIGLSVFGLGYDLSWTYEAVLDGGLKQQVVLAGILIGAALSLMGIILSQSQCTLRAGRLFGWIAVLVAGALATFEGATRGTFSTEYVILIYLLIVAIIPFRPTQVAGIGASVALIVYLLGPSGVAWQADLGVTSAMAKHLAFIAGGSVLVSGASVALYLRHRSFGDTQASLKRSRDLLRRSQEVGQVGGWEFDVSTSTLNGTDELYHVLDLPKDTHLNLDAWLKFFPSESRADVRTALSECINDGESFDMEVPLVTATDEKRWVRLRGTARKRKDEIARLTGILQDITEQHEIEERLRERERLLKSITENVSDGIYRTEPGKGLVYANRAFATLFGYEQASDMLGMNPEELYAHPEEHANLFHEKDVSEPGAEQVVFRKRDGSTFVGLLGGTVVRDNNGEVKHVDGVVADITDLKRRERMLQGQRDRFETLFESLLNESEHSRP